MKDNLLTYWYALQGREREKKKREKSKPAISTYSREKNNFWKVCPKPNYGVIQEGKRGKI
jgi:hypothetical protein